MPDAHGPRGTGVVVLGMHRSGTSAVAGALRYVGLRLPDDYYLLPPHPDNPRGYFENGLLVELNDILLGAFRGDWSAPPSLSPGWEEAPELQGLRNRARAAFRATMPWDRWLWKDPRTCLTLPFWLAALGDRPAIVLVHRAPWEVVRSLRARDGFSLHLGLALWERYTQEMLTNAAGLPAVVTEFRGAVADPVGSMRRIGDDLASVGVPVDVVDETAVGDFLSPSLPSTRATPGADAELLSPEQRELLEILGSLRPRYESFPILDLPPATGWSQAMLEERRGHLDEHRRLREDRERFVQDRRRLAEERRVMRGELHALLEQRMELLTRQEELLARYREEVESKPLWWRKARGASRRIRSRRPKG